MVQYQRGEHAILESYKNMRTSLIVNKSSDMDEGKTTVISSLAKCFSELEDKKTLLIDCDLRNPSIHRHFELDNEKGLIDVIEEGSFKEYIKKVDDLHILTTGRKTKKPAELLESDYMKNFIEEAKEYYDYIFIDSPPVSRVNDACILANYIDGTVIVSASNEDNIYHKYYGYYDEKDMKSRKFKFKWKR